MVALATEPIKTPVLIVGAGKIDSHVNYPTIFRPDLESVFRSYRPHARLGIGQIWHQVVRGRTLLPFHSFPQDGVSCSKGTQACPMASDGQLGGSITNCRSMEIFRRLGFSEGFRKVPRPADLIFPMGVANPIVRSAQIGVTDNYPFDVLFSTGLGADDKEVIYQIYREASVGLFLNRRFDPVWAMAAAVPCRLCKGDLDDQRRLATPRTVPTHHPKCL
jgi:hypothetical protein